MVQIQLMPDLTDHKVFHIFISVWTKLIFILYEADCLLARPCSSAFYQVLAQRVQRKALSPNSGLKERSIFIFMRLWGLFWDFKLKSWNRLFFALRQCSDYPDDPAGNRHGNQTLLSQERENRYIDIFISPCPLCPSLINCLPSQFIWSSALCSSPLNPAAALHILPSAPLIRCLLRWTHTKKELSLLL